MFKALPFSLLLLVATQLYAVTPGHTPACFWAFTALGKRHSTHNIYKTNRIRVTRGVTMGACLLQQNYFISQDRVCFYFMLLKWHGFLNFLWSQNGIHPHHYGIIIMTSSSSLWHRCHDITTMTSFCHTITDVHTYIPISITHSLSIPQCCSVSWPKIVIQ